MTDENLTYPIVVYVSGTEMDSIRLAAIEDQSNPAFSLAQLPQTWTTNGHSSPLFGSWLKHTKELQEKSFGLNFDDLGIADIVDLVRTHKLAADDELHEALKEISWKPWASAEFFNREAYIGELVDVLHHVGILLLAAETTDKEVSSAYAEKMRRNEQRQKDGYTGTDKCDLCGRAADDVRAHGGYVRTWDGTQKDWGTDTPQEERQIDQDLVGYGCNQCYKDGW